MNPCVRGRCERALCSQANLSGEIIVGEMIFPVGVMTPIMSRPIWFHGDVGGTKDVYGSCLGMESLSGSPSSNMIWRRSS